MNKKIKLYNDNIGHVELVDYLGSDLSVVNSARVSFGKHKKEIDKKDKKLIEYLIKHRHTSTLEHCSATFRFKVPLFVRSQHHRHRTWSYSEISRRYTDYNIEFYEPKEFRTQHKSNRQASNENQLTNPVIWDTTRLFDQDGKVKVSELIEEFHAQSLQIYNNLLGAGICREQARGILPQNMYTEYYGTANLNNILKFTDLRIHEGAQWEIQQVAKAVIEICKDLFPITINAYKNR